MDTRLSRDILALRVLQILLLLGMFAAGAYLYPQLPDRIPTHWSFDGTVDGWSGKAGGAGPAPLVALGLSVALPVFRMLDPRRENYAKFARAWAVIQLTMVAFFAYVYALQMIAALRPEIAPSMGRAMMGGIGVLFILMGNYFGKVRHNYFVGIRTPWTLASEEVWNRTHRLGGWLWVAAGALVLLEALLWVGPAWLVFSLALGAAAIAPIIYSYVAYHGLPEAGRS